MSKRTFTLILVGIFLVALGAIAVMRWPTIAGWLELSPPEFTAEIPRDRPRRIDQKLLNRFEGQSMEAILEALAAEREIVPPPQKSRNAILLAKLPDAPLPYGEKAAARDGEGLKSFILGVQQNTESKPTEEDLFRFNLALAAMKIPASQVPAPLRIKTQPVLESETFPVRLIPTALEQSGPIATGNFDGKPGLEIVSNGGSQINSINSDGTLTPGSAWPLTTPADKIVEADFDGDGDLDAFLIRGKGLPNSLLENDGNGGMKDVTIEKGLLAFSDTSAAAWLDYDGDGLLDLLVGNHDHPLELYHQTSGGAFQPVAWDLKWWVHKGIKTIETADFTGDGLPDVYLGLEDRADQLCVTKPGETWEEWRFEDVSVESDLETGKTAGIPLFTDFDNDGSLDLVIAKGEAGPDKNRVAVFRNLGKARFRNVTEDSGVNVTVPVTSMATADIDGDGFEDLIVGTETLQTNRLFWNQVGSGFREVSAVSGGAFLDSPVKVVSTDLDANGMIDLLVANDDGTVRRLEATDAAPAWISLHLSRPAPGARIELQVRDKDWIVHPITRHLDSHSQITIGVGNADVIESIEFFSPGEKESFQKLEKVEPNQHLEVEIKAQPRKRPVVPLGSGE
ncbi:VCBS repeat-containing protein [Verrucomicrobiales bacterium BCK34]|nr:VCBS repeat-containing protein [Verrucomicrobiales bacterium BCK34]